LVGYLYFTRPVYNTWQGGADLVGLHHLRDVLEQKECNSLVL
jgi:hypothetical protein